MGRRAQLLGEQRVALRARPQPADEVALRRRPEDVGELLGELGLGERPQLDAPRARLALQLGQQRPQRVAAMQLVGAVAQQHEQALRADRAREEGEERARGAVGPVQVLDEQDEGLRLREGVQQCQQRLEQAALRRPGGRAGQAGQERGQLLAQVGVEGVERRIAAAGQRTQRRDQRGVGQLAVAEIEALAREHTGAGRLHAALCFGEQPALADAGLTRDERQ